MLRLPEGAMTVPNSGEGRAFRRWALVAVEEVETNDEVVRVEVLREKGVSNSFRARFLRRALFEMAVARLSCDEPDVFDQVNQWGDFHAMALVDVPPDNFAYRASSRAEAVAFAVGLVLECFRRIGTK
jgi:hypothetical protein